MYEWMNEWTCRSSLVKDQILVLSQKPPEKVPFSFQFMLHRIGFARLAQHRTRFWLNKKNVINHTGSGKLQFYQAQKRKETERPYSACTPFWALGAAMVRKKNLLRPSSFLLRRSPSSVRSAMPLHGHLVGVYDYRAWSVGLKWIYTRRLQEKRSQSTVDRGTVRDWQRYRGGGDVLANEHCVCGRDQRLQCEDEKLSLHLSAMCRLFLFFFSEGDKDVVYPR